MEKIIIDGGGGILGRLGTLVAKELLKGKEVVVVNSEQVIVSGDKKRTVEKIGRKQKMGHGGSLKGPIYPRIADRLLKRMIRGMLPWDRARGREAYKRLKCFTGNGNLKEDELKKVIKVDYKKPYKYATMEEIIKELGK